MGWTVDGEWIPEEVPAFYQGEDDWTGSTYETETPALSAPAGRNSGASSTPNTPAQQANTDWLNRDKWGYMKAENDARLAAMGMGLYKSPAPYTIRGGILTGGLGPTPGIPGTPRTPGIVPVSPPASVFTQALPPLPSEQTEANAIYGSSVTSGTSTTGPSTSTRITGPSTSISTVAPSTTLQSSTSTNMSRRVPTMALPEYKETPALTLPERDRMRERSLAQEESALGVGEWRQSLRQGLNKIMSEGNFASRGAQLRQMLSGAGQGLGRILQAASSSARSQYNAEYQTMVTAAVENYRGQLSEHLAQFQSAVGMYLGTMGTETTQTGTQTNKTSGGGSTTSTSGGTVTDTSSGGTTTTTGQTGTMQIKGTQGTPPVLTNPLAFVPAITRSTGVRPQPRAV